MAKTKKTYRVSGLVKTWVDLDITAESMEQALQLSRDLRWDDFVVIVDGGEHVDSSLKIHMISDNEDLGL